MAPDKDTNETKKKEFGTGLRAQLERRREEPEEATQAVHQPNVDDPTRTSTATSKKPTIISSEV